jgi:hypothetical protein
MVEFIQGVVAWVGTNWAEIAQAIVSIIGAASIIVKLTPTLKDDDVLKGVIRFLGKYIALNRGSEG